MENPKYYLAGLPSATSPEKGKRHPRQLHIRIPESRIITYSLTQIRIARTFASNFVVITNTIFNINKNNLPLLVLIYITNTLRTFLITYYYIISKSAEAFTFINICIRNLFFSSNYRGMTILLGDFTAGLIVAITSKRKITLSKRGINIIWDLTIVVDDLGSQVFLQLCNWHAVEIIKARLIRKGYPTEDRKELHHKV